jgi:hypothetical protein
VKTEFNLFHMRRMVRIEVVISASVDGSSVNFGG